MKPAISFSSKLFRVICALLWHQVPLIPLINLYS
jgi:hypothetical protein